LTNNEILTTFREFVGDSLDSAVELALANQAKTEIDTELKLRCMMKLDTSQTTVAGQTYTTAKTLPTDILIPAGTVIYVGETPYTGVQFEHKERYKNRDNCWWADLFNGNFYLSGTQASAQTITFPYIATGTAITASDTTVLKYPTGLHIIIPISGLRLTKVKRAEAGCQNGKLST
jgi:hypothetical protein